jgi:putative inorganic carbon (HCO3(-)) transporter
MSQKRSPWRQLSTWLADWQIVPVALLSPILVFSERLPPWMVALALLGVALLWLVHWLARGHFFTRTPADVPLLILLSTLPVGLWASAEPATSLPQIVKVITGVALFYALVNTLGATGAGRRAVGLAPPAVVGGTALLAGLVLLGTNWPGAKLPFLPAGLSARFPRPLAPIWYSAGFHPNTAGGVLAMFVPVTAAYVLYPGRWWRRLLLGVLLLAEGAVLVLTQSRGAMMGLALGLVAVAILRDRRWAWAVAALAVAAAVAVVVYGAGPALDLLLGGPLGDAVAGGEVRLELVSRGLYMISDFSLTGIGPGMFPRVLPLLYPLFLVGPDTEMPHVHNVYLQQGIDHGVPGLVAFLALLVLLGVMGWQAVRSGRRASWGPLAAGLLGGLAAYLLHGWFDAIDVGTRGHFFVWALFGLLAAVWHWSRVEVAATARPG